VSVPRIGGRDRRALLVGAVVIGASLAITRGLPALRASETELRDRLVVTARAADAAERERDLLASSLSVSRARGAHDERRLLDHAFAGESPTEVGALAAQYVLGVAEVHGGTVQSVSPSTDSTFADGALGVEIQLHLTTDAIGLFSLLDELGRGPRLTALQFVRLSIGNPTAAAGEPEALRVEVGLTGVGRRPRRGER
jgi:hypothetical protein